MSCTLHCISDIIVSTISTAQSIPLPSKARFGVVRLDCKRGGGGSRLGVVRLDCKRDGGG